MLIEIPDYDAIPPAPADYLPHPACLQWATWTEALIDHLAIEGRVHDLNFIHDQIAHLSDEAIHQLNNLTK